MTAHLLSCLLCGARGRWQLNGQEAMVMQVNERVARRREQRQAADAVQQALLQAKVREQEQFEAIKAEFGVDTSTVRSAFLTGR